ncbi:MAG: nucleotidyltransferase family protein [Alphaproteobacteria bacterium]|nr:nucleotidyltransferase family protein [Alphaproteobacteria bacterium]
MIRQAFILAAGYGTRMQPITNKIPKPIIEVHGMSIINRAISKLIEYGIEHIVINSFYKKELLIDHINGYFQTLTKKPKITILEEEELLDTGGGVLNALQHLRNEPFFIINSDSIFVGTNVFSFLNESWNNSMNTLFLLNELKETYGYDGKGDFSLDKKNQLVQNTKPEFAFSGVHITKPELFDGFKIKPTKLITDIYTKYKKSNTYKDFYGKIYSGLWFHVGTPESIKITEEKLKILENHA